MDVLFGDYCSDSVKNNFYRIGAWLRPSEMRVCDDDRRDDRRDMMGQLPLPAPLYSFALQRLHPAATPKHLFIEAQKNMDRRGTICFPQQDGAAACGPRAP